MARRLLGGLVVVVVWATVGTVLVAGAAETLTPVAQGSVEQVAVVRATPEQRARLVDRDGVIIARKTVDPSGAVLFRKVPPGPGYVVEIDGTRSGPVAVTSATDPPPVDLFVSQRLEQGFQYIRTRDGTLLSANVTLPGPVEDGPYPTVVEYSGYDPSNPAGRPAAASVAQLFGFATVGVNLRGTGCSGGAWDYFEPLQSLDGYDVIETVAAQPWVAHGKVGMVGISYPGITQLFVAGTRPPHLAAITPLSVLDDTYATLAPGGIFNDGFGLRWAQERQADAAPRASAWVRNRIDDGDTTCASNQALRLQAPNVLDRIRRFRYHTGAASDALAPATFADRIDVPVFIAGSWQDEETGAHFAEMLDNFGPDATLKATVMNGTHADSLSPEIVPRWLEFLEFYVARRVPSISEEQRLIATVVLSAVFGGSVTIPPDRFDPAGGFATALATYEAEPMVRARFDSGAGAARGAPIAAFEAEVESWPAPSVTPTTWYFSDDGTLVESPPRAGAPDAYEYDPAAFPRVMDASGSTRLDRAPEFDWKPLPDGRAVAYVTEPLARDTVMLGTGSVDLWVRSTATDVDLEVTISEVRPDGQETYVQSGWMRTSLRALDEEASTSLLPVPTFRKADAARLPANEFTRVRVPLYPFGHAFREGSRVRIAVQPPGGNRPSWAFDALQYDREVTNEIGVSGARASRVVLPVLPGVDIPTALPECGSLRGQPCRPYVAPANAEER